MNGNRTRDAEPTRGDRPIAAGGPSTGGGRVTDLAERRGIGPVYEPAEDSALLAGEAVEHVTADALVLDVGTGSGYVGAKIQEETGATVVGADINPHACRAARDRGVPSVRADLTTPFRAGTFDVVVFNPPYLPIDSDADSGDWLRTALSGGADGRAVIERFLKDVGRVLAPDGAVLLLVSTATGPEAVVEAAGDAGFSAVALLDATFPGETLTVLKLTR